MEKLKDLKTFEDACKALKLNAEKVIPDFSCYPKKDRNALVAHAKLVIIVRAANKIENEGKEWFPNWKNSTRKYHIWFNMNDSSSASGFASCEYDCWRSLSVVSSRLCFKSMPVVEHVTTQFLDLYEAYFVN
ncbi:hypothetical protein JYU20_00370 [Bacteroidales bacterium AH-315-I05]|nr:hypothetical protein [Bacteroidales bacterium AH-315-I05]